MNKYEKLKAIWYRRLAESGFADIEQADGRLTDRNRAAYAHARAAVDRQARSDYYRAASAYLWDNDWGSLPERRVWALHADGLSNREIAAELSMKRTTVWEIVCRHRAVLTTGLASGDSEE